jgi:hypothetical protein
MQFNLLLGEQFYDDPVRNPKHCPVCICPTSHPLARIGGWVVARLRFTPAWLRSQHVACWLNVTCIWGTNTSRSGTFIYLYLSYLFGRLALKILFFLTETYTRVGTRVNC